MSENGNNPAEEARKRRALRLPTILANKVRPPCGPEMAVVRPRLLPSRDDLLKTRLILIKAFAGYGKTTLLRQQYEELISQGFAAAWLRFDAADNETTKAVAYLATALGEIDPALQTDLAPYFSALPPLATEDILAALINRIEKYDGEVALLIDDYHTIANPDVHDAMSYFLINMPENAHCIIASRTLPPWPISEIIHSGGVRIIDEGDIRFNADEVVDYLRIEHDISLDRTALRRLSDETEGWIAAIKLAAMSLEKMPHPERPSISGSHRGLVDYLTTAVFERLDEETQDFLLRTGPLDRLCASLCDAVTGAGNARFMLEKLQRENLFLEPLDAQGDWFRYHSLFSEFLNDRLERAPEIDRAQIHRNASYWFEVNRQPYAAAEHAMAAGDETRKAALIEAAILDMVRASQISLAIGWYESLPEAFSKNKPNVLIPMAWSYIYSRQVKKAEALLNLARRLLTQSPENMSEEDRSNADAFLLEVELARLDINRLSEGELPELRALAAMKSELRLGWHFLRAIVELFICYRSLKEDRLEAAFAAASDSVVYAKKVPNAFVANLALEQLAHIRFLQGRLEETRLYCSQAIDRALDTIGDPLPVAGRFHLIAAKAYYESNDLTQSRAHLDEAMQLTAVKESSAIVSDREILAARHLAAAYGERAAAQRLFEYNIEGVEESGPQSINRIRSFQAWFLTGCGDLDAAEGVLRQLAAPIDSAGRPPPTFATDPTLEISYLALSRYLIATGRADPAANWLRHLLRLAERAGRLRSQAIIHGLLATAQALRNQHDSALRHVREMLHAAEQGGLARTVVDLGGDLLALLGAYRKRLDDETDAGARVKLDYVDRLLEISRGNAGALDTAAPPLWKAPSDSPLIKADYDRLTKREVQILELIATGKKNREVALELLIQESSVRWHVRNLYAKLGVHNRTEASAKARALKLIH